MTDRDILFRRQFLMTQETCKSLDYWQYKRIGEYHLYAHPDVELSTVTSTNTTVTVTLIGYILDPYFSERSNTDIIDTISTFADSTEKLSDYLDSLSGRFVLIINTEEETLVFHDPCGLRTVYYMKYKGKIFIGSQPLIFKEVLPLKEGERFTSYLSSPSVKADIEYWIPSGCSLYEGVYHLVPNHYLSFSTLEQTRYWPKNKLPKKQVDEAGSEVSDLLQRMMVAGNNRFKLALPLTAGLDSRMLLSASKSIANDIYFYTLQYRDLNFESADISIPRKLLQSLGLTHHIIDCRKTVPEAFRDIYQRNTSLAHMDDLGNIAYGMGDSYPQDRICVKGTGSDIGKCAYYQLGTHEPIHSYEQILALVNGWQTQPFIRDQISSWYDQASEVATEINMNILDLFYWEHRMGSWMSQSYLEWDIVQEVYTPFNHRGLLELMLSVPAKSRDLCNNS
ncbi:hypothetical protein, partial [Sulfurovum sp.]|uniref:hypothetical protein n=1 Tax=Sulfurovum sp. TaxID=1969726 RepID=UPI0025DDA2B4